MSGKAITARSHGVVTARSIGYHGNTQRFVLQRIDIEPFYLESYLYYILLGGRLQVAVLYLPIGACKSNSRAD